MENPEKLPHKVCLDERNHLNLTGAKEVIHFDDEIVELNTSQGIVLIQGADLRLKCLSLDTGTVVIHGKINGVSYEDSKVKKGFFR